VCALGRRGEEDAARRGESNMCVCGQIKNFRKSGCVTNVLNSAFLTVAGQRLEEILAVLVFFC
jgi:hypothetical protein